MVGIKIRIYLFCIAVTVATSPPDGTRRYFEKRVCNMRRIIWPYVVEALGVRTLLLVWNVSGRCFALLSGDMK